MLEGKSRDEPQEEKETSNKKLISLSDCRTLFSL